MKQRGAARVTYLKPDKRLTLHIASGLERCVR
jgi:hypothetical protein